MPHTPDTVPRSPGMLIVATITAVVTVMLALRLPNALKSFAGMFKSFGADVPAATK